MSATWIHKVLFPAVKIELAKYATQMEHGDFNSHEADAFELDHVIPYKQSLKFNLQNVSYLKNLNYPLYDISWSLFFCWLLCHQFCSIVNGVIMFLEARHCVTSTPQYLLAGYTQRATNSQAFSPSATTNDYTSSHKKLLFYHHKSHSRPR